jgi:hypothetical protein
MTWQCFKEEREKCSWHDYQLYMSKKHKIKCLWNSKMKLYVEDKCFIHVSIYFIWCDSLKNNVIKLPIKNGLPHTVIGPILSGHAWLALGQTVYLAISSTPFPRFLKKKQKDPVIVLGLLLHRLFSHFRSDSYNKPALEILYCTVALESLLKINM